MIYNISQFKVFDFTVSPLLKHKNLVPLQFQSSSLRFLFTILGLGLCKECHEYTQSGEVMSGSIVNCHSSVLSILKIYHACDWS
jgi:hypothetical protein